MSDGPGLVFDRVAEEYDRVRPNYPAELVDAACAGLRPGAPVLEIGCGTGKLTRALAERGLRVDAVDPGPALVELARRAVGGGHVSFHVGRFEDVDLPAASFDAVFSATAFHWIDPHVGWRRVARVLRPGGRLALLTHVPGDAPLRAELVGAYREVLPDSSGWEVRSEAELWHGAEERRGNVSEVWTWLGYRDLTRPEAAELFDQVELRHLPRDIDETADEYLAHVRTESTYIRLAAERQERLEELIRAAIGREGGFRGRIHAVLVTAVVAGP
ncbi:MAG: class I SAM-dependent methyltransferase [Gaiellaceae bacterium]